MLLNHCKPNFYCEINLPTSKSIYNRAKILKTLYNLNLTIKNPSNSDDSVLLDAILESDSSEINCKNAGTVFRFLTAYYSVKPTNVNLSGTDRMHQRPIGQLVDALNQLGANIQYLNKEGFPPLQISKGHFTGNSIIIGSQTSSQFISALMMIGPYLENGLRITLEGKIASKPYVVLTQKLMMRLGFECTFKNRVITTRRSSPSIAKKYLNIEPDWSAMSFWFQIIAFSNNSKVFIKHLKTASLQGDAVLLKWAPYFGLKLTPQSNGMLLEKTGPLNLPHKIWDLHKYPDLAPSLIVMFAALKIDSSFVGLESLKIKECDRTLALQKELKKCKVDFFELNDMWILKASNFTLKENTEFENYDDHRIAMALGCLSFLKPIRMANAEAVNKSYPDFWKHLSLTQTYICDHK